MDEFLKFCADRAKTDGQYAIAYAILLTGKTKGRVRQDMQADRTKVSVRQDTQAGAIYMPSVRDHVDVIERWLLKNKTERFCLLDVWVDALGRTRDDYTEEYSRSLGKAVMSIRGCRPASKKVSPRWGQQRSYTFAPPAPTAPADDDDLGI